MKKNKTLKHKLYLTLVGLGFLISIPLMLALAFVQSAFVKNQIQGRLAEYLARNQVPVTIEKIEGLPPLMWKLRGVEMDLEEAKFKIDEIKVRLAFSALLKKELCFSFFQIQNLVIEKKPPVLKTSPQTASNRPVPLTAFRLKNLSIEKLHFNNQEFSLKGSAFLARGARSLFLQIALYTPGFQENLFSLRSYGSQKSQRGRLALFLKKGGMAFFTTKFQPYLGDKTYLALSLGSSYENLLGLFSQQKLTSPLTGNLKGQLAIEKLPSAIKGLITVFPDFSFCLKNFSGHNELITAQGELKLSAAFNFDSARLKLSSQDLSLLNRLYGLPVKGLFSASIESQGAKSSLNLNAQDLVLNGYPVKNFAGRLDGAWENGLFFGNLSLRLLALEENLKAASQIAFDLKQRLLTLEKSHLSSASFTLETPRFQIKDRLLNGPLTLTFSNLKALAFFFPQTAFNGKGKLAFNFQTVQNLQQLKAEGTIQDYYLNDLFGSALSLKAEIKDPFSKPEGSYKISAKELKFHEVQIKELDLSSYSNPSGWDFALAALGHWKSPLKCQIAGSFKTAESFRLCLPRFSGEMLGQHFFLTEPLEFTFQSPENFELKNLNLKLASGDLKAGCCINQENSQIDLTFHHFPLDFFSFNPLEIKIAGFASGAFHLAKTAYNINSDLKINLEELSSAALNDARPLSIKGEIEAKIENSLLTALCNLKSAQNGLLALDLTLPLKFGRTLFNLDFLQQKNLQAKIAYEGRVEDLLDFFDLRHNHLEGNLFCQINLSKNLINPEATGFVKLENGLFENYYTGSFFHNISADLTFAKNKLILEKLLAYDNSQKPLSLSGSLSFNQLLNYPYNLLAAFDNTQILKSDFLDAKALGSLEIKGNREKGLISGSLEISSGKIA
ncbi:MAG: translocation/assembly module TamB domain-containing protein, partial [Parachlamydiales bacterium]